MKSKADKSITEIKHSYYFHINVVTGFSDKVSTMINAFMMAQDAYDPRSCDHYPCEITSYQRYDSVFYRRKILDLQKTRTEFWKVRRSFSLKKFEYFIYSLPVGTEVRVVRIIDNQHDSHYFCGRGLTSLADLRLMRYYKKKMKPIPHIFRPSEDYYILIDAKGTKKTFSEHINSFMVKQDCFDPSMGHEFPSQKIKVGQKDTIALRRKIIKRGKSYTRFWKVHRNFNLSKLCEVISKFNCRCTAKITKIINGNHFIETFHGIKI